MVSRCGVTETQNLPDLGRRLQDLAFFQNHKLTRVFSTISTNDDLKKKWEAPHATTAELLVAETQTGGRGQHGRQWLTKPGQGLTFSFDYCTEPTGFAIPMLTGVALINALRCTVANPEILWLKWPNDVWAGQRKLAGILVESCMKGDHLHTAVGIGVNLSPLSVAGINAISLEELGNRSAADLLIFKILQSFNQFLRLPAEHQKDLWVMMAGKFWQTSFEIVASGCDRFVARPVKLLEDGALVVKLGSGERRTLASATLQPVFVGSVI